MWSNPSVPGKISTKAPKSARRTTLPRYVLPTSATAQMSVTIWIARSAAPPSEAKMLTLPSSSTSIFTPVASTMPRMTLPRPDEFTDFVDRNLHRVDARRVLRQLGARLGEHGVHLVQQEQAAAARLFERFRHQRGRHVRHLEVHLQGRDAGARTRHLEVHIAVVIFGARDVREDRVEVAF